MRCPLCREGDSKVVDSREVPTGIRRRRECLACGQRFTTYERAEEADLMVVKRDGRREPFSRQKLLDHLRLALTKRPVPSAAVERLVDATERDLFALGKKEVESKLIGEKVMERLRELDEVAYMRFASVYRRFQNVDELAEEIDVIRNLRQRRRSASQSQLELPIT